MDDTRMWFCHTGTHPAFYAASHRDCPMCRAEKAEDEVARLKGVIEKAKAKTRGWCTGGYPPEFMALAHTLYHALEGE